MFLANPKSFDLSPEGYARTGADVVRWFAALVVGAAAPDTRPLHQFIASSCNLGQRFADLIRQLDNPPAAAPAKKEGSD